MNLFDFLAYIIDLSSQSFVNFAVTFILLLTSGILLTALVSSISDFRLFEINRKPKDENILKLQPQQQQQQPAQSAIYDMLIQAWERYKKKGKG